MAKTVCKRCNGKGNIHISHIFHERCPRCKGYGMIEKPKCPNCNSEIRVQLHHRMDGSIIGILVCTWDICGWVYES